MSYSCVFFFNDTATTEIYTLSLHDALPIFSTTSQERPSTRTRTMGRSGGAAVAGRGLVEAARAARNTQDSIQRKRDRKSTRLNSSHANISYAVFCLKKKNIVSQQYHRDKQT